MFVEGAMRMAFYNLRASKLAPFDMPGLTPIKLPASGSGLLSGWRAHFEAVTKGALVAPSKMIEKFFCISSFPAGL